MKAQYRPILITLAMLFTVSFPAYALKTVAKSGGDFSTIAAAVTAASAGEEIRIIDQGAYAEAVTLDSRQLTAVPAGAQITGNTLTISGTGAAAVRGIRFEPGNTKAAISISGASSDVQIEGVTIVGAKQSILIPAAATVTITTTTITDDAAAAILIQGTNPPPTLTVRDSLIARSANPGIRIARKSTVTVIDTTITSSATASGILLNTQNSTADDTVLSIRNSSIVGNAAEGVRAVVKLGRLTVENSVIRGNSDGFYFGTVGGNTVSVDASDISANLGNGFALNTSGAYTITNSTITSNTLNGIRRDLGDTDLGDRTITITGNTISGNGKNGIILRSTSAANITALITGNTISGNKWRALATESNVALNKVLLTAERNILRDGSANTTPTVALAWTAPGSLLVNNLLDQGLYGLTLSQAAVEVYHNTLVGSDGTTGTAVAINDGGSQPIRIVNNILDRASFGVVVSGAAPAQLTLDYNLVNGKTQHLNAAATPLAGAHNLLGQGAKFVAASPTVGAGNYHLAEGSPAIDAGDSALGITADLENHVRPSGLKPDLGAYEVKSNITAASSAWLFY